MADNSSARRGAQLEQDDLIQLVGFNIGKEMFVVDILMVQEIIRSAPITPVPNSPEFVEGVINLRGDIIPVVDLRKRLGLSVDDTQMENDWVIILDIEGRITGFIVDHVTEVLKIDERTIEPAPELLVSGLESQYIQGVCDIGSNLVVLLDFSRILLVDEISKLKSMNGEDDAVVAVAAES